MGKPKSAKKTTVNGKHSAGSLFAAELAAQEPLATLKAIIRGESGTESKSIVPSVPQPTALPCVDDILGVSLESRGLAARVVVIDKATAERWLAKMSPGQRRRKNQNLERLRNALIEGFWMLNGETIIFNFDGELIQGQHRLQAVIDTGISIESVVIWGVSPEAYLTLDNGAKRTGGDALEYLSAPNATCASATTLMLIRYMVDPSMAMNVSRVVPKIQKVYNDYKPHIDASVRIGKSIGNTLAAFTPATMAFAHLLFSQVDRDAADAFFASLRTGSNLPARSPITVVRDHAMKHHGRIDARKQLALLINTWNACRRNVPVTRFNQLSWTGDQSFPSIAD